MGTSTKATKARRAILTMAQQWKDVFDELPFLEQAGDLNNDIAIKQDTLKALADQEAVARSGLATIEAKLAGVNKEMLAAEGSIAVAKKAAQEVATKAEGEAKLAGDRVLKDAKSQAAEIVAKAADEASKARSAGISDVNKYRANLKKEIDELEHRLAGLQDEVARAEQTHSAAMESIVGIRKLIGIEKV